MGRWVRDDGEASSRKTETLEYIITAQRVGELSREKVEYISWKDIIDVWQNIIKWKVVLDSVKCLY